MVDLSPQTIQITISVVIIIALLVGVIILMIKQAHTNDQKGWKKWIWLIITLIVTVGFSISSILIYFALSKYKGYTINVKIIALLVACSFIFGLIVGGVYRAVTYKTEIPPDKYSETRMTRLDQALTSYFGPRWPVVFILFAILLIIVLVLVYFTTRNGISVSLNDNNFGTLQKYLLIGGAILTVIVFVLVFIAYRKYKDDQEKQQQQDGDFADDSSSSDMAKDIGLLLGILLMLAVFIWLITRGWNNRNQNKKV